MTDKLTKENEELRAAINFIAKTVERGIFDQNTDPKQALINIGYDRSMPWYTGIWDVNHKEYATEFHRMFPSAEPLASENIYNVKSRYYVASTPSRS